jgi:heptosyltransferase-3
MILDALSPLVRKTRLYVDGIHCSWFGSAPLRNRNRLAINMGNYFSFGSLLDVFSLLGLGRMLPDRPTPHFFPAFDTATWMRTALPGFPQRFLAIHAGNVQGDERLWPRERFQAVADWIVANTDLGVLEVGLEPTLAEGDRVQRLGGQLTLSEQMAVLAKASGFLGGDSGFAHMANALALPSVILLGAYRDFVTYMPFSGPWRDGVGCTIIHADGPVQSIAVASVIEALGRLIPSAIAAAH